MSIFERDWSRRQVIRAAMAAWGASALTVSSLISAAQAQDYPSKPVTLVVPFAPGGRPGFCGKAHGGGDDPPVGPEFIVENLRGAAASLGYTDVSRAKPDGYRLLVGFSAASTCSPSLFCNLKWAPIKNFKPIGIFGLFGSALIVNPSVEAKSVAEFVAYLKAHPGELNFGSSGIGSNTHIVTELFMQRTGTEMVHIPYKSTGELMADLLANNIQVAFAGFPSFQKTCARGNAEGACRGAP